MWQRLAANWRLLMVLAFGILVASTLMAVSPVYTRVMNDLGLQESLEDQIGSSSRNGFSIQGQRLGDPENARREQELAQAMSREIGWFNEYEVRYGGLPFQLLAREGQSFRPGRDSPADRRALDVGHRRPREHRGRAGARGDFEPGRHGSADAGGIGEVLQPQGGRHGSGGGAVRRLQPA